MENKNVYQITTLKNVEDDNMHFKIKVDVINTTIIVEGYYKVKLEGNTKYRLFDTDYYKLNDTEEGKHFDDIIDKMIKNINERVTFVDTVKRIFKNVDGVDIKK